jgi:hypothetical protein
VAASINPDDLDALDQHAPLTKTILENLLGRGLTEPEFNKYFTMHPNASRVFAPDYQLFLTARVARDIPSVVLFHNTLAQGLSRDMDDDADDTEALEERRAEQAVINSRMVAAAPAPITSTYAQYGSMYAVAPVAASPAYQQQQQQQQQRRPRRRGGCAIM